MTVAGALGSAGLFALIKGSEAEGGVSLTGAIIVMVRRQEAAHHEKAEQALIGKGAS